MGASDGDHLLSTLRAFVQGSVDLQAIVRAREIASQLQRNEVVDQRHDIREAARAAFNTCVALAPRQTKTTTEMSTHMRALCLRVLGLLEPVESDSDLAARLKAWGRTGAHFGSLGNPKEADRCFDEADALLGPSVQSRLGEPALVEALVLLKGWHALVLHLTRRSEVLVLQRLQETQALCDRYDAKAQLLLSERRYVAEHVAFAAAANGFDELKEGASDGYSRRVLIRLCDLALAILGEHAADTSPHLRDRVLRLKCWLCLEEDELDDASQALSQHGKDASIDEHRLLHLSLLFRTNQQGEACEQALQWLRTASELPFAAGRDAMKLLLEHNAAPAALQACDVLLDRLRRVYSGDDALNRGRDEYSEMAETKFFLLTETVPDSAAASDHLEAVIDDHCSGRHPLSDTATRAIAAKLWERGCSHFQEGDLHQTSHELERAFRFLDSIASPHADDRLKLCRAQATLAHVYLLQDKLQQSVERAKQAISLGSARHEDSRETSGSLVRASVECSPWTLAQVVLIKARLKLDDTKGALEDIRALVSGDPSDHLLIASITEEISSMGTAYVGASVAMLEHLVRAVDESPLEGGVGIGAICGRHKLLAITRSLVMHRLRLRDAASKGGHEDAVSAAPASGGGSEAQGVIPSILSDIQAAAKRVEQEGVAAVCDDPEHVEWLGDKAWELATEILADDSSDGCQLSDPQGDAQVQGQARDETLALCAGLLGVSHQLSAVLPVTDGRLQLQLRAQSLIGRVHLQLASKAAAPESAPTEAKEHLKRAAAAVQLAFRLHQRAQQSHSAADDKADPTGARELAVQLQLLNFEVSLRRGDANLPRVLNQAAETEGVGAVELQALAQLCLQLQQRHVGSLALEGSLALLLKSEHKDHEALGSVLRQLVQVAGSRVLAKPHFEQMQDHLQGFSVANCPLPQDDVYWFMSESWNRGVQAFKERKLSEAEEWMTLAFKFCNCSAGTEHLREHMLTQYQVCLTQLSTKDPREMAFRAAMNERIRAMTDCAAEVTETDNAMSRAQSAPPLVV